MRTIRVICMLVIAILLLVGGATTWAQQSIFHDPFLNWDFINFTGVDTNDFEIVVAKPNWTPSQVYTGFFPDFTTRPDAGSGGTVLSWSGNLVAPGQIAHVGAAMMGSGSIVDAYWTKDGEKVGPSLAIVYERTQVFPFPDRSEAIAMNLQVASTFQGTAGLQNIRTFSDLPADFLGLDDLTRDLDLNQPALQQRETIPTELVSLDLVGGSPVIVTLPLQPVSVLPPANFTVDSFFDVFVDVTFNVGPTFESLLTADVVVFNPSLDRWEPIGRFWNLNPQSPEPSGFALLCVGMIVSSLQGRRVKKPHSLS